MCDTRAIIRLLCKSGKKIFFASFLFFTMLFSPTILSQSAYNMYLTNAIRVNANSVEFEVYIKGMVGSFNLTSYQCSFLFNTEIVDGGRLTFTYVDGTSQLTNLPSFAIGINNFDGQLKLTFASIAGLDIITESPTFVGKFRLLSTEALTIAEPNITWNFGGNVSTILTDETFQNITVPSSHNYNLTLDLSSQIAAIPNEYKLFQNYPNPFNPTTKITFSLPKESNINLTVYNLLGQEIAVLVNDRIDAGAHSVDFVGEGLPSGMYFGRLKINDKYTEIIKMILLR